MLDFVDDTTKGTAVAIKRIKKRCFVGQPSEQERLTVEFSREAVILSKLHHPNVMRRGTEALLNTSRGGFKFDF
ncbi:putative protein kinase-like domain superfamily [Helianthus annuus]|nr:putative protein kinase-like domain superfamily [Helianthus annuus]